jgi:type IV secretory pathway VirB3-like protein
MSPCLRTSLYYRATITTTFVNLSRSQATFGIPHPRASFNFLLQNLVVVDTDALDGDILVDNLLLRRQIVNLRFPACFKAFVNDVLSVEIKRIHRQQTDSLTIHLHDDR